MTSLVPCPASTDDVFGPQVDEKCRNFDFTMLFEETILSLAPSLLFLLVSALRIWILSRKRLVVNAIGLKWMKMVSIALYGLFQLVLVVLWSTTTALKTRTTVVATVFYLVDSFVLFTLSYLEHSFSVQPSALLNTYLFVSILFDIARTRTLWLVLGNTAIPSIFTVSLMLKSLVFSLELAHKARFSISRKEWTPEERSGVFDKSLFTWLNKLMVTGFQKILSISDLFMLSEKMRAESLQTKFYSVWKYSLKEGKHALIWALFKTLLWPLLAPILPRLSVSAFTFAQPFLINRIISFLSEPETKESKAIGYGLIAGQGLVYSGLAIAMGWYRYRVIQFTTSVRGILVQQVYNKTVKLGVSNFDNSNAVTLMSTDVERIVNGLGTLHDAWCNFIDLGIAIWLLARQLQLAALAPLGVAILCGLVVVLMGSTAGTRQKQWMQNIEIRIGVISKMLDSMKGVKISGLSPMLAEIVQNLRIKEIASAAAFRHLLVFSATMAYIPTTMSPVVTFGSYIGIANSDGESLDVAKLFTSLSLLTILARPLASIFGAIPNLMAAFACIDRIQAFLESETRIDKRRFPTSPLHENGYYMGPPSSGEYMELNPLTLPDPEPTATINLPVESLDAIVVEGDIGWEAEKPPVLHNLSMRVKLSQLVMVVGPVACGKSTLLKGILGEAHCRAGSIYIGSSDVAFCDQTPWLRNTTVQENILGFSVFNELLYNTVIEACALQADLQQFPKGDQSILGSKGISLSGGQKQRLAMARALYANKKIAIFDDCLSGLDATTSQHVFREVFGKTGLLRRRGTTVLIATHAVHHLPFADHIIVLSENGGILEQGNFNQLNATGGYVHSLYVTHSPDQEDSQQFSSDPSSDSFALPQRGAVQEAVLAGGLNRIHGDTAVYLYYAKSIGAFNTAIFIATLCMFTFLTTFPSVWLTWWADYNALHPNAENGKYIGVYAALQVLCLITLFLGARHVGITMVTRSGKMLHRILVTTVMAAPMRFFNETDTGITTNRFSQDMELIDAELPFSMMSLGVQFFGCIAQAVLILKGSYYIGVTFVVLIPTFYLIQKFYLRTSRQLRFLDLEAKSPLYSLFIESLHGLSTIRAFGWEPDLLDLNLKLLDHSQRPFYLLFCIQQWLALVLGLLSAGLAVILVALVVTLRSISTPGFTGLALLNMMTFNQSLMAMVVYWTKVEICLGAVARIRNFELDVKTENLPDENDNPPDDWPRNGDIEFRNVSASYKDDSILALKNFSLSIESGEKIAICGRTGSGKSSLVQSLFRMIEMSNGSILVDGLDISHMPRHYVRSRMNALPQDPYFLGGTFRLNVDPFGKSSDEEIIVAFKKVNLMEVIEERGGLDATLEVEYLSHGQRQLFCLARAILRHHSVVVLDEATSSLDIKTDKIVQRVIREEFQNSTLIVVAHRLDTILDFDRIAVLDDGRLIECDSPASLLSRESAFQEFYRQYNPGREEDDNEHEDRGPDSAVSLNLDSWARELDEILRI